MNEVEERILQVEKEMAHAKGRDQATQHWAGIFGIAVLAWLGITSFVQIPYLVDKTAAGKAAAKIEGLQKEAESNVKKISDILKDAVSKSQSISPIRWVTVEDLGPGDDGLPDKTRREYCFFDRTAIDDALDWKDWHDRRVLIANVNTGDVSIGMIFRKNSDVRRRRAHVRFGAPLKEDKEGISYKMFEPPNLPNRQSKWNPETICTIGIVVPPKDSKNETGDVKTEVTSP